MKSILRSTAILSSSSVATLLVSLVSAKVMAVLLGPKGFGLVALLQSLVGLSGLIATMGITTGLVRDGSNALSHDDHVQIASFRRATWVLTGILGASAALLLIVFRLPVSHWVAGSAESSAAVALMSLALLFGLAAGVHTSTLNAYHCVEALAQLGVATAVATNCATLLLIWLFRERGIVPAIIIGSALSWVLAWYFLSRHIRREPIQPVREQVKQASWSLLRFGAPYTAGLLVGRGAQLAMPILVLHLLGTESVGLYRAAVGISVGYLGFLVTAMSQDYYPRISAVLDHPGKLNELINQQHRLLILLAGPIILVALAVTPFLVPIVYSQRFTPAVEILEWQLIGDLLKFSCWTMSYVMLVRRGGLVFFLAELIYGIANLGGTWVSVRWFGLAGLGIGFLVSYAIYYLVVLMIVRSDIKLVWTRENKRMLLAALAAALAIRTLPMTPLADFRTPIALLVAAIATAMSFRVLWRETDGVKISLRGAALADKIES